MIDDSWQKIKEDKISGLKDIYDRNIKLLKSYGTRISDDNMLVEDCIQDLFLYIWQKRASINCSQKEEAAYLCLSLRREILRRLKRRNKEELNFEYYSKHSQTEGIDSQIIHDENQKNINHRLRKAMDTLSSRQREAIYLKFNLNLDYDEISEILEINYQSCRNLVFRALSELRAKLIEK